MAPLLAAVALVLSALGILMLPVGTYDDSALLVGARLVAAGKLPYVDFYTFYGPLPYSILGALLRLAPSAGLALRISQVLLLVGLTALAYGRLRKASGSLAWIALPVAVGALAAVAGLALFFGFAPAVAAAALWALGFRVPATRARTLALVASGACLALAALSRPVFAGYIGLAMTMWSAVTGADRARAVARRELLIVASAAATFAVLWVWLWPAVPIGTALDAVYLVPRRLLAHRAMLPRVLDDSYGSTVLSGALLALLPAVAVLGRPDRRGAVRLAALSLGSGLAFLAARLMGLAASGYAWLGVAVFAAVAALVWFERTRLASAAAAALGLCAAAFVHYFLARPDRYHLLPFLSLAVLAAVFSSDSLRAAGLASFLAAAGLLAVCATPAVEETPFPALTAARSLLEHLGFDADGWAEPADRDARAAVALADAAADPKSSFVAVGSSQAWSEGDPVVLFLLSRRLPYTRWYAYDPGVQSSEGVQRQMLQELARAGSSTAVVWDAERFVFGNPPMDRRRRTRFDAAVERRFPLTLGRFGPYLVRGSNGTLADGGSSPRN